MHRRRARRRRSAVPPSDVDSGQLPDPGVRAAFRRRPGRVRGATRGDHQGRQGHLARRALRRTADGDRRRVRLRPVGSRGVPRRDARLLQRFQRVPLSRGPRNRGLPRRDRRARGPTGMARGDDATGRWRVEVGIRRLPCRGLRRADRPPRRDLRLHARVLRGRWRGPRRRDRGPARRRPRAPRRGPGAHLPLPHRAVRRAGGARAVRALPVPGARGRRRLRGSRAPRQHEPRLRAPRPAPRAASRR